MNKSIVLTEFPGSCNFQCSYCLPTGTKISINKFESINIEDLKIGDKVLSYPNPNLDKHENLVDTEIVAINKRKDSLIKFELENGIILSITGEHKILARSNYIHKSSWRKAKDFKVGQKICGLNKVFLRINKIELLDEIVDVYNLQTTTENYIANNCVVHNCYINKNDNRRKPPFKKIDVNDYKKLIDKLNVDKVAFHFCGIGEPLLYPYSLSIIEELSKEHAIFINTNFAHKNCDRLLDFNVENIAIWFSLHWDELKRMNKLDEVKDRIRRFQDKNVNIHILMVAFPSYLNDIDNIINFSNEVGIKIKIMHYRDFKIGRGKEGLVKIDPSVVGKVIRHFDSSHWDYSFNRWNVNGKYCHSGINFLVINSKWDMISCGGKGHLSFGKFPESLDNIEFKEKGVCESLECPCSWVSFSGCVDGIDNKLEKVLTCNTGELKYFYGD